MEINIDKNSGFCFGVLNAISVAEKQLEKHGTLFCLGDIVHNNKEIERLSQMGLITINHSDLENLYNTRVLIRAHGEPPQTYNTAIKNNIEIIEASCPVVLKLQKRIKSAYKDMSSKGGQIAIFGKEGHAEVLGLLGQTDNNATVIGNNFSGIEKLNLNKPITLFSQTTQDKEAYEKLTELLKKKHQKNQNSEGESFRSFNTICGQVSNRGPRLAEFASQHDVVIFVSGKKSSNGKYLFNICAQKNPNSYFISDKYQLLPVWFSQVKKVGVCGATSTPMWLMEEVAREIEKLSEKT